MPSTSFKPSPHAAPFGPAAGASSAPTPAPRKEHPISPEINGPPEGAGDDVIPYANIDEANVPPCVQGCPREQTCELFVGGVPYQTPLHVLRWIFQHHYGCNPCDIRRDRNTKNAEKRGSQRASCHAVFTKFDAERVMAKHNNPHERPTITLTELYVVYTPTFQVHPFKRLVLEVSRH